MTLFRQHSKDEDKNCKASWVLSFETHTALLLPQMLVKERYKTTQVPGMVQRIPLWKWRAAENLANSLLSGEGNGTPLQHSCLENPMDGGAW